MTSERAMHDVGGLDLGPIDRSEHPRTLYELRVDAILILLTSPACGAFKVDGLRRAIEEFSQADYDHLPYYDRWLQALTNLLVEQQVLSRTEIDVRLASITTELVNEH